MKRLLITTLLKLCGEAILIALVVAILIALIGNWKDWDTSLKYSNAFFIAGCLLIIAGGSSKMAASSEWFSFQRAYADSFRDMSPSERANYVVDVSSSGRLVFLGLLSGILLIIFSVLVTKWF